MIEPRRVTDLFAVSPQIKAEDLSDLALQGFERVINNRPDGEAPGQPSNTAMAAAASAAGLDYVWIPITGSPTPGQADAQVHAASEGKTLAFCRSGTRSITAWAMGQARAGAVPTEELLLLGEGAGYDLSWLR